MRPAPYRLIAGGTILDPASGLEVRSDLAIADGRVSAIDTGLHAPAGKVWDATGCWVVPGLMDLHTHCAYRMDALSISADEHAASTGTVTWVDAGSAGAANFAGFREYVIDPSRARIVPLLNISEPGLTNLEVVHGVMEHMDVDSVCRVVETNGGLIRAIKVLNCAMRVGNSGLIPLRTALEAGDATDLPVMCHIGLGPPGLRDILPLMRPGDIITHCYKGHMGCLLTHGGVVRREAWEARERGVLFDVGHGSGSFSWGVARRALDQGFPPDVISTDLHASSVRHGALSLPSVMSKFLHLGMELAEVMRLATVAPAAALGLGDELGSLAVGREADVTVLRVEEGEFPLTDTHGVTETVQRRLVPTLTLRSGVFLIGGGPPT